MVAFDSRMAANGAHSANGNEASGSQPWVEDEACGHLPQVIPLDDAPGLELPP